MGEMTFPEIKKEAGRMGYKDDPTAQLLLSAFVVGPNQKRLRDFTGFDAEFVREKAENLRKNDIWVGGRIKMDDPEDGLEFSLMCATADGLIETAYV